MRTLRAKAPTLALAAAALVAFAAVAPAAGGARPAGPSQQRKGGQVTLHHHRDHRRKPRRHRHRRAHHPGAAALHAAAVAPPAGPSAAVADPAAGGTASTESVAPTDAAAATSPTPPTCVTEKLPMGCPIQTITSSGGIQVGNESYPAAGNWVRLLVLDPTRLTPVECGGKTCDLSFNSDQTAALLQTLGEIPPASDDLAILTGQGNTQHFNAAQISALTSAFEKLGGTLEPDGAALGGAAALHSGAWSLLGRVGATGGFAEQNNEAMQAGIPEFLAGSTGERGSLNGYLQVVNNSTFEFVSPEYVSVDTAAPGSTATQNLITVGEHTYRSQKIQPGQQGFQILFLPNEPDAFGSGVLGATLVTRNADGSINASGVHELAYVLGILRNSEVPGQEIGIVQSFGRSNITGLQPISNNADWIADELPFAGLTNEDNNNFNFFRWCGTGEDSKGSMEGNACEPFPNAPTSFGKAASVTQIIGELAGMRARNEVANAGVGSEPEALSMISPAHPYSENDAQVAVGEKGMRTLGVLRRSRQSQWTIAGAAPGVTNSSGETLFDPASMWEVIFGTPHEEWPDSGPPGSSMAEASRYIAGRLFPGEGYTDVRQAYSTARTWVHGATGKLIGITYPAGQRPHFSRADFEALKSELMTVEFPDLENVETMTSEYQGVFTKVKVDALINFKSNGEKIIETALKDNADYQKETATVNEGASIGTSLYFASDLIGAFGAETEPLTGPLDFFAGTYDFFSELYGSSADTGTATQPFGEPQMLRGEVAKLGEDMAKRYESLSDTFGHFEVLFDTDWGRLRKASENSLDQWDLPQYSDQHPQLGLLTQSLATAGEAGLYEALMPIAYEQWVISPWWTENEGALDNEGFNPATYSCLHENNNEGGPQQPFKSFPESGIGLVRFEADLAQPYRNHFTARVLISKADPLTLEAVSQSGGANINYPGVKDVGAAPEGALTEKLFDPPTKATEFAFPDHLGLSEAGFFGLSSWSMPRLQCGMPIAYGIKEGE
jgi:hypothetical protein